MESITCDFCEKIIEGYTYKQINYLMLQHIISKHNEQVMFKGGKKWK